MKRALLILGIVATVATFALADDPVFYFKNELHNLAGYVKRIMIKDNAGAITYNFQKDLKPGDSVTADSFYPSDVATMSILYCDGNGTLCVRYDFEFTDLDKNKTKKLYLKFTDKKTGSPVLEPQEGRFLGTRTTGGLFGDYSLSGNVKAKQIKKTNDKIIKKGSNISIKDITQL